MAYKMKRRAYKKKAPRRRIYRKKSTLAKKVKSILQRTAEVKTLNLAAATTQMGAYAAVSNTIINMCPNGTTLQCSQGTDSSSRVGNRIRIKSAIVRGYMVPNNYDVTYNSAPEPQEVRMVFIKNKQNHQATPTISTIFQNGATSSAPASTLQDIINPLNADANVIYKSRVFKVGTSNYPTTGGSTAFQYFQNNDFKLNQKFVINYTKFIPKVIEYNDASTISTSAYTYMMFFVAGASGGTGAANSRSVNLTYNIEIKYTDF